MSILQAGDHVVAAKALFGSCLYILENVLPRFGVEVTFVDGTDLDQWRDGVRAGTKAVFFESISNPTLEVIDIAAVSKIAHDMGAMVLVDNVFATPVFQNTFALGADVVIYSATKHIDGQGRCLGGVVLGSRDYIRGPLETYLKHTGGAMSPFNAWVLLKSMETLDLRCRAQAATAKILAAGLDGHEKLTQVIFPGLPSHAQHQVASAQMDHPGTMLAIDVAGGQKAAFRFLNALKIFTISNNLGDAKSIATHPATTTHQRLSADQRAQLGITPGLVRLSVGLEHADDLLDDLITALGAV
jgi:O-succinylhomoserine sulfhydrylase